MNREMNQTRRLLTDLFNLATARAHPAQCLPAHLPPAPAGRLIVLAGGKAAGAMAETAEAFYGPQMPAERITGLAVARHGYGRPTRLIRMIEAGHPVPDEASLAAAGDILALAESAGPEDLVLALLSGGASAHWVAPAHGLSFADKQFDFVICSHTLEDLRDPLWVCSELMRVGKRGYVEVPSREWETCRGAEHPKLAGLSHHRWLIEKHGNRLDFVFKHHVLHNRDSDRFPPGFQQTLKPEERVVQLWWEDSFEYGERVFIGADELDPYLADFVAEHRPPDPPAWRRLGAKVKRRVRRAG